MLSSDKFWISKNSNFSDIVDSNNVIEIKWNRSVGDDYIFMAEAYYRSAELITIEILNEEHDNSKYDQWFFSAMYLFRQAIELLCKGIIVTHCDSKTTKSLFLAYRHNVFDLFKCFLASHQGSSISKDEATWLMEYLSNLEAIDKNSNLFRYPIKDGILNDYQNDFLDIVDMANGLSQCYSILYKYLDLKYNPLKYSSDIDINMSAKYVCKCSSFCLSWLWKLHAI